MAAPVWEKLTAAERAAYEREHGVKPAGYRGTGSVEWFERHHPDEGPCCKCGETTDRWVTTNNFLGDVAWGSPHVDDKMPALPPVGEVVPQQKKRAICGTMVAFCWPCERAAAIAVLKVRQQNPEILPEVRASEAAYLAELVSEANCLELQ